MAIHEVFPTRMSSISIVNTSPGSAPSMNTGPPMGLASGGCLSNRGGSRGSPCHRGDLKKPEPASEVSISTDSPHSTRSSGSSRQSKANFRD